MTQNPYPDQPHEEPQVRKERLSGDPGTAATPGGLPVTPRNPEPRDAGSE
jgi:hypothetical protein